MLRGAIPVGRIAGIRISVHWSLIATLALLASLLSLSVLPMQLAGRPTSHYWIIGTVTAALFILTLVAHEFAHSVVARRHGVSVDRVTLWLLGGMSELRDEPPDPQADLHIALAGPITSLLIGVTSLVVAFSVEQFTGPLVTAGLIWLGTANLILAIFNLLPGAPLDGGRVLRAVLWRRSGDRLAATTSAARSGRTLGLALILLGGAQAILLGSVGGLWLMLLGWFLRTAANVELMTASARHRLGDLHVADAMTPTPLAAAAGDTVEGFLATAASSSHHRLFPVVDPNMHPIGVITLSDLARTAPAARSRTTIGSLARPLPDADIVTSDALLADVATAVLLRPGLDLIAVVDGGQRLTGIVTATDLVRVCDRTALGLPLRHHPTTPGNGGGLD
ncbi:site-2 protease family protein [Rhodococcus opacus]|uniref:Zinc metalloprotease n=2 Tax=Rhodococcus opacus TaxID=37919 RepID=K8XL81_RHOOP|nr:MULTISPECIES: site-2 protease family protein [Rhodococcus]ANS27956.1 peptidase M50 [Rhodococcus opacus]EKT79002.1 peptidase M50 [Rhodococcus opacus M213]MBA8962967.1 Zn-dependent protease [Rhodococcus opacus]MBP2206457.1 Zn-dependent protease/CBS domain-containing protein [Rhodococcus opacus]MDV6241944.1 site-2 protease family protein [Rhodococcus opacus]